MGLFDFFSGQPKQFVTRESFESNLENQKKMSPQTLEQLRKYNVAPEKELKLEFFFYTNTLTKAAALANALSTKQYQVAHKPSASNKKVHVITGWTDRMLMHNSTVVAWTEEMCKIGFEHDCEFDGWGTNPEQ